MQVIKAMALAIDILRQVASACENSDEEHAKESGKKVTEVADTLEKVDAAGMALASSPTALAERLEAAGIDQEQAAMFAIASKRLSISDMISRAADFEQRMVAAGLDPKELGEKIQAAVSTGNREEARAIFENIHEQIKQFENNKSS